VVLDVYVFSIFISFLAFWYTSPYISYLAPLIPGIVAIPPWASFATLAAIPMAFAFWSWYLFRLVSSLPRILLPEETTVVRRPEGELSYRSMSPLRAVETLRVLSKFDQFKRLHLHFPTILLVGVSLSISLLVLPFPLALVASYTYILAIVAVLFALLLPSLTLAQLPSLLKLESAVAVLEFIPAFRKTTKMVSRSVAYLNIKDKIEGHERFLLQKLVSYTNEFVNTLAPGVTSNTSRYWATLYVARTLRIDAEEGDAGKFTVSILDNLLQQSEDENGEKVKISRLLEQLFSVETRFPGSWGTMTRANMSVEPEKVTRMTQQIGSAAKFGVALLGPQLFAIGLKILLKA
jgi:hypothetical protein